MLVTERSILGRNSVTIVRVLACFDLIDEIADGKCVILGSAEYNRLLVLNDIIHENLHSMCVTLLDLVYLIEIGFRVTLARLYLSLHQLVVRRVDILIE